MSKSLSQTLRGTNYGTLPVSNGGTGLTSPGTSGNVLMSNGTGWTSSSLLTYTLPTAGASTLGGIKVGTGLTIDGNGILTTTNSGTVTSVAGTAPITSSGGATPTISIPAASTSASGYLTSTDWNTFNSKQAALVSATNIKTVNGTTLLGSGDLVISGGASATKTIANKTAAYTVVAGDLGTIINCTSGTFTITLTDAATLGAGFTCTIWNQNNSGSITTITIDPNASETIGGKGTWTLRTGEGVDIVCNGTNWEISYERCNGGFSVNQEASGHNPASAAGNGAVAMGWDASAAGTNSVGIKANASTDYSVAIGSGAAMSGGYGIALGYNASATGGAGIAIGPATSATNSESVAIGRNSGSTGSQATGAGAMALGGSYASGTDSFAAAIASNTSSYGATGANSVAIGRNCKATSQNAVSYGQSAVASGFGSLALGSNCTASNTSSVAIGLSDSFVYSSCSGAGSIAINGSTSSGQRSFSFGLGALSSEYGKYVYAPDKFSTKGDAQFGKIVLRAATTTTTAVVLTSDQGAASTTNQLIVASGQAMAIQGTLIAKVAGTGAMAGWNITGIVSNSGGGMTVSGLALTAIGTDSITLGASPTIAVDNTNKGVKITSGYKSATSIRWVATVNTSEVVY